MKAAPHSATIYVKSFKLGNEKINIVHIHTLPLLIQHLAFGSVKNGFVQVRKQTGTNLNKYSFQALFGVVHVRDPSLCPCHHTQNPTLQFRKYSPSIHTRMATCFEHKRHLLAHFLCLTFSSSRHFFCD